MRAVSYPLAPDDRRLSLGITLPVRAALAGEAGRYPLELLRIPGGGLP